TSPPAPLRRRRVRSVWSGPRKPLPRRKSPSSKAQNPIEADVAVVGSGPAGAAAALFAARRGHRVIVFDKQDFPRDKPCGEGLMPGGRPALRELGLENDVVSGGAPPLRGIQFGLAERPPAAVPFPQHDGEQAGLGIRRLTFDARLADA